MKNSFKYLLLLFLIFLAPGNIIASEPIQILVGHSLLLPLKGAHRLAVGNPDVIQAKIMDATHVLVNGINNGRTNLILLGDQTRQEYLVQVRSWDLTEVEDYSRYLLGESAVLTEINGRVFLTGEVGAESIENTEESLRSVFPGLIVKLRGTEEIQPVADWNEVLRQLFPGSSLSLKPLPGEILALTGQAANLSDYQNISTMVAALPITVINLVPPPETTQEEPDSLEIIENTVSHLWPGKITSMNEGGKLVLTGSLSAAQHELLEKLISSLSTDNAICLVSTDEEIVPMTVGRQIKVQLSLLEMDTKDLQELGFDWEQPVEWSADSSGNGLFQFGNWVHQTDLVSRLHLLTSHGKVRILAEPELTTLEGEEAIVHVGGEIPVSGQEGGVEWKEYGISMRITPTLAEEKNLLLAIETEVSSLDWVNAIEYQEAVLPAISSSSFSTMLSQPSGTSAALGGLLERRTGMTTRGVPGLSSLPLLGELFSWDRNETSERELVAIVTATLLQEDETQEIGGEMDE